MLSMMSEKARTYAVSGAVNVCGCAFVYCAANFSMMRSICCASPGSLKSERKKRSASSKTNGVKSRWPRKASIVAIACSSVRPR